MSKKYKFWNKDKLYFVTLTVNKWIDLFIREEYKMVALDSIKYCQREKGLEIYAWVIMTSHMHMIIGSKKNDFSDIMRDLKKYTSKKLKQIILNNKCESRKEWLLYLLKDKKGNFQLWISENHPIELDNEKIMNQKLDYIHENPVKGGFVENNYEWLYSSARNYEKEEKGLIEIDYI